ncbi:MULTISPECIES: GntR family transcriptional regulator [Arthrobacter]|uniref:GntR family transcriptional regulator n=2 Tax=Arthrobacter TaxID=1663 RepID=A0ABU9KFQ2_9MICC|nr:GntR family transcriptional regulator [Arthrobacter sp. YJM1]MDP5225694.1 GntR family transcriptional regulator [Arthrobacter sp. YJM1]
MSIYHKPAPTAPEIAYEWLRREISALPWDQEIFLSESAIAEAAGVSRTPVREALLRLEASGLIRRVAHKGAFVPALTGRDIDDMVEVRRVIGDWAVRKVSQGPVPVEELQELLNRQAEALQDPVAFIEADVLFHQRIVSAAGNPIFASVYEAQRFKQLRMGLRAVVGSEERSRRVLDEHQTIVEALQTGDPDKASAASLAHLNSTLTALHIPHRPGPSS